MARFQAVIETDRAKKTSRLANKWGCLQLNTWDRGVLVEAQYNDTTKEIIFSIWETGGSNHPRPKKLLARLDEERAAPICKNCRYWYDGVCEKIEMRDNTEPGTADATIAWKVLDDSGLFIRLKTGPMFSCSYFERRD